LVALVVLLLFTTALARPSRIFRHLEAPEDSKTSGKKEVPKVSDEKSEDSNESSEDSQDEPSDDSEDSKADDEATPILTTGCEEKENRLTVCATESTITYRLGNPDKGKVNEGSLTHLENTYAIYYRGKSKSICDIQSGENRETNSGKKHKFCQAPEGSKVVKVRARFEAAKLHTVRNLEFIWRTPDGSLFECGWGKVSKKAKTESVVLGDDTMTFQGFRIVKQGKKYTTLIEFVFGRSVKGMEAHCSTSKVVAVVDKVMAGIITTESLEEFEGTTKIENAITSHQFDAGVSIQGEVSVPLFGGMEASASFSYSHTSTSEKGKEEAKSETKSTEITFDLTDKFMVSYFLMIPCKLPEKVKSKSGSKIFLAPYDHRNRRLILPMESCLSESQTIKGSGKGKVNLVVDGSVNLDGGSCKLPKEFIWFDEKHLLKDISYLVDIKGSGVVSDRNKITLEKPNPVPTVPLE
jgi:hypothetical protein